MAHIVTPHNGEKTRHQKNPKKVMFYRFRQGMRVHTKFGQGTGIPDPIKWTLSDLGQQLFFPTPIHKHLRHFDCPGLKVPCVCLPCLCSNYKPKLVSLNSQTLLSQLRMARSTADDEELRRACEAAIDDVNQKIVMSVKVSKSRAIWGKGKAMSKPRVLVLSSTQF